METAAKRLSEAGVKVQRLSLPEVFAGLADAQATVMYGEGRAAFLPQYLIEKDAMHPEFVLTATGRRGVTPERLRTAYDLADTCRRQFDALRSDFDVVLAPAAAGEAPEGLHTVGDWIFNGFWTLLHVPCVAVPATKGAKGLPVGIQLVGPRLSDARLLAIARTLAPLIDVEGEGRLKSLLAA
jgi:Asp-tRNA(Asn)/Glu-tRNA(Gln) amidotransferase A subunit family amidase